MQRHGDIVTQRIASLSSVLVFGMRRSVTDARRWAWQYSAMAKKGQRQFIREWRKFRGLTQEQLAERMGIARSYVSHVEKGKRRYDQIFLEAAALAMNCTPADLIMRDPLQEGAIWSLWDQIPVQQRDQAFKILETFTKKTGTDN